jgi:cobalt/nickel transport system ATP-binding protein
MNPALEIKNLGYRYPDGCSALAGIHLSVTAGECVGLLGPNGSGKSTLLRHLNGILPERPSAADGSVLIHGAAISATNVAEVRRQVGLLFQDPDDQLFCSTVCEDVSFGPKQFGLCSDAVIERVNAVLDQVGLTHLAHRAPHHLSAGEKRRACLAGVLACAPSILALDEPSSGLDPRGRRELIALLRRIDATKLIATHDLELVVELCPRSIILDQGRIIADGATLDLLNDETFMLAHGLERPHILRHRHPHRAKQAGSPRLDALEAPPFSANPR